MASVVFDWAMDDASQSSMYELSRGSLRWALGPDGGFCAVGNVEIVHMSCEFPRVWGFLNVGSPQSCMLHIYAKLPEQLFIQTYVASSDFKC